jgi:hypothetical protein
VPEIGLQRTGIVPCIGQCEAASMSEHVGMNLEPKSSRHAARSTIGAKPAVVARGTVRTSSIFRTAHPLRRRTERKRAARTARPLRGIGFKSLERLEAGMALLADHDMVVDSDIEGSARFDQCLSCPHQHVTALDRRMGGCGLLMAAACAAAAARPRAACRVAGLTFGGQALLQEAYQPDPYPLMNFLH